MITKEELIEFEKEIEQLFLEKKIRAPVHLSKGNEDDLIRIFEKYKIGRNDWVFSTHRSHYHALLKGIPKDWLMQEILEGRSMHIFNREHNFFSSAIIGGICPIAVGIAMGIEMKGKGGKGRVFCFIGDMVAETGIFHESSKYAEKHGLLVTFIVEDNGFSTNTPTQEVWGHLPVWEDNIERYEYEREYPHVGVGKWVTF